MTTETNTLSFDHLVVMMRDQLTEQARLIENDGYTLTDISVHNLGSMNRLITLQTSYIELLGWPTGTLPQRKEIAGQSLGLDALVFRSTNAHATRERLLLSGYAVNAVQRLERPLQFHGRPAVARFDTLRFAEQPVPGLRMYFCQHLTPDYVWDPAVMRHANGTVDLHEIELEAANAQQVAATLADLTQADVRPQGANYLLTLPNLVLRVRTVAERAQACVTKAWVRHDTGEIACFNTRLPG